jgi:hypothetical protein
VDEDEKDSYNLHSEGEKLPRRWGMKRLHGMMMYLEVYSDFWEKIVSK